MSYVFKDPFYESKPNPLRGLFSEELISNNNVKRRNSLEAIFLIMLPKRIW